jgi:hypothetical protein
MLELARRAIAYGGVAALPVAVLAVSTELLDRIWRASRRSVSPPPGARVGFEQQLRDPDPVVRRAGAVALGELGDAGALASLRAAAIDEQDADVLAAIDAAIERLGG